MEKHSNELDDDNGEEEEYEDDTDRFQVEVLLRHDDLNRENELNKDNKYKNAKWPDKSISCYAMLDFESDKANM